MIRTTEAKGGDPMESGESRWKMMERVANQFRQFHELDPRQRQMILKIITPLFEDLINVRTQVLALKALLLAKGVMTSEEIESMIRNITNTLQVNEAVDAQSQNVKTMRKDLDKVHPKKGS